MARKTPVRYPNGLTNVARVDPLAWFGLPDPSAWHTWFDDFDIYTAGDWTITTTELGTGSATEAIQDADGGVLLLTNAAGDNDHDFLQYASETFTMTAGKQFVFKARFKVSDATQSDFVMGLQITDTTPLDVTDGIFVQKDDGDTNLDAHVEKNNTATSSTGIHTVADDTYLVVGIYYNGTDEVQFWVDGAKVASLATTNLPDDEEMTISFGIQNGEAVAKTMSIDYILAAKER